VTGGKTAGSFTFWHDFLRAGYRHADGATRLVMLGK
jgi:hypothetical protein